MASQELYFRSAAELGPLIRDKKVSPVEVTQACLRRAEEVEPRLNSFITLLSDQALQAARKAEREILRGQYRGALHGIPLGLKDVYETRGIRTTFGCKVYDDYIPEEDSTTWVRLREAGAILLGKLNLHTLQYGPTGQNDYYGDMHNPWEPSRYTGGSSGGSASAAATGECIAAMGTDSGGSIRIPAGLCGIVGLKTTFGRLSRHGLLQLSESMDHHGPMTRTVRDCALVLNVIAGHDPKDPGSSKAPVPDYAKKLNGDIKGLRIGVPKEFFQVPIASEVRLALERVWETFAELGGIITEVSWPLFLYAQSISGAVLTSDVAENLRQLVLASGSDIDPRVRHRIESGFFIPATRYLQAQRARTVLNRQSHTLLKEVDILAGPTVAVTAPPIGDVEIRVGGTPMHVVNALTQYTRAYNLNGLPAISIPCGFSKGGLPIGLQLAGRPFDEETVLRVAYAYEQATSWKERQPTRQKREEGSCP